MTWMPAVSFLADLLADARYALRGLRKSPAFTAVALLTLALSIGANVVVFGVLNAVVLRPLAVSEPASLYQLRHKPWASGRLLTTSYPAFEDMRERNTTFSGMAAVYGYSSAGLRWRNAVRKVHGIEVTGNYFDLLGVQPQWGRLFHAADEHGPGSAPYVVLSDALWRSAFAADPGVIGATLELNKHPFTVVGVVPREFHGLERFVWPDYWIPMANQEQLQGWDFLHSRSSTSTTVIGRLKPGVTPAQATENLNAISAALATEYPETDAGLPVRLIHPGLLGDIGDVIRGSLWSVTALALLVLAAACANLASLFAARTADRSRELALRVALGASRQRLVRQLLTEAMVVAVWGGTLALVTAALLLGALNHWDAPLGHLAIEPDPRVLLAAVLLALGSALLFGIVPARQAWHGPAPSAHRRRLTPRDLLLGVQIALCTLLVMASLVAVRGMRRALDTPLGFEPQGALLVEMDMDEPPVQELLDAARAIPGVTAAGAVSRMPMTGGIRGVPVYAPGTTNFNLKDALLATYVFSMSPGYLEAAGTRLVAGRDFSWHDTADTTDVAIVNEAFARKLWADAPALGQRFVLRGTLTEVVGVTETGKYHDLTEAPMPALYLPLSQGEDGAEVFVVRSLRAPGEMAAALQRTLGGLRPDAAITLTTWPESMRYVLFPARAAALALGVLGLLAAMLAVTGIFGMAAYNVSRRMKELGIRAALGARATQVMSAAVGRPMLLLAAGSALGLLMGVLSSRLLEPIVYEANPSDPAVVAGALLTMALLGLAASAIPARRALAVDVARLMRED